MGDPASDPCWIAIWVRRISCRCRRPTSWRIPNCSASPASNGWRQLAALPEEQRQVRIPTITDPRGTDFAAAARLKQQDWMLALERRAIAAFQALGVLMTDTCINYQTIMPAVRGEHMAYGDTGVVIYSNSVLGARSNFEGGPSALAAGPDRTDAALRLSPGGEAARHAAAAHRRHAAGAARLGRTRRRCRPDCRRLLAGAGADRHRSCSDLG